ncbi:uncharacterized protein N7506_008597 [Penicillium brevicompactum]|uniref:uncharacterized protein n=1 Tax=Penicillium brevicompactum TaxID=5074 RepID=UPI0025421270|nr:uncharacterized protein N7506_008597 [Penicillium brevicompactum]KAJ5325495.1 hypothetical protein N7506_008597 [Penicillium brevicompactum]
MFGRPRSQGCILCRKRKVKCDEGKPACGNCAVYGRKCPGYQTSIPLVFRNENKKIERLVKKDQKGSRKSRSQREDVTEVVVRSTAIPTPEPDLTIPRFLLDSSWEYHGHCYFLDQFTLPIEPDGSPEPLDSIPMLYTLCQRNQAGAPMESLRAAMDAAAFASMANHANVSSLAVQARKKYGQALKHLNIALSSVQELERQSLMSTHVAGIQYLLKLRGVQQLGDPATRSLFHFAFTQMLIQFVGLKDPVQIDLDWLLEVLSIPHPIYQMMAGNIKITKFCAAVASLLSSAEAQALDTSTLTSLLERGEHIDLEFSMWHSGLPEVWMPRKFQTSGGDKFILYPDLTSAGVWNYYRGTRIILQQTLLDIYRCLDHLSVLWASNGAFTLHPPEEIIIDMVTEICDTIPFALGKVDTTGRPIFRSETKAVQGFALLWPVFSVTQCGYATEAQDAQARSALQVIGSTHGIRLGMDLSREMFPVNRAVSAHSQIFGDRIGFMNKAK